jgi:hypothetical protein
MQQLAAAGDEVELHFHDCNEYWIIIEGKGTVTSENFSHVSGANQRKLHRVTPRLATVAGRFQWDGGSPLK